MSDQTESTPGDLPDGADTRKLIKAALGDQQSAKTDELIAWMIRQEKRQVAFYLFGLIIALISAGVMLIIVFYVDGLIIRELCLFLLCGLAAYACILLTRLRSRGSLKRMAHQLKEAGIRPRYCLSCYYDLKGSIADSCPECGERLAPDDNNDL